MDFAMAGTNNQSVSNSTRQKLEGIVQGDMSGIKKLNPSIVVGPRLVNSMWKRLINKYIKEGLSYEAIVKNIITIDGYIESQKLTEELIRQKMQ